MTNELTITISGKEGAGKTRLSHLLGLYLELESVSVIIDDGGFVQPPAECMAGLTNPMKVMIRTEIPYKLAHKRMSKGLS